MSELRRYFKIWICCAGMALQAQLSYRLGSVGFVIGKLIRVFFFFAFIVAIFSHVKSVAGYSLLETALFFMTFNLVDIIAQIFFRGVYGARRTVSEGDFDFYLIQPCSPLFRMVATTVDFLDAVTILPVVAMTIVLLARLPSATFGHIALYAALIANAVVLIFSIHVAVAAIAVRTQELENAIWIYRDIMFMGKFPASVYARPVRYALTFLIPIAVMTSFPASALLGRLSIAWILYALALSAVFLTLSIRFWQSCVAHYTSSSS